MLSSKANAALTRVREIEEKYKLKRREQRWNRKDDTDSSISSVSLNLSENSPTQLKDSPGNSLKPKLDVKMPDIRFEGHDESEKLPSQNERSDRMNQAVDEADLDVVTPTSEDKSSSRYSIGKQESFASGVITIQENSSIESVPDDSVISSKSLSRSETRRSSAANEKFSRLPAGRTKAGSKSEKGRPKMSKKSIEKVSESHSKDSKPGERSIEGKTIPETPMRASSGRSSGNSNRSSGSLSSHADSVIDESIDTSVDGSETISELSHVEKSEEKIAGSFGNVSGNSVSNPGRSSIENALSRLRYPIDGNSYANDTFEDTSSSAVRSKSGSRSERTIGGSENKVGSVDDRDSSSKELTSDHVVNVEMINNTKTTTDKRASRRKKSSDVTPVSRRENDREERGKVPDDTREHLMMDVVVGSLADDWERTMKSDSSRNDAGRSTKSASSREKTEPMESRSLREKSESTKSSSREKSERSGEDANVPAEGSDRRIVQRNVTNVLRKLHRDSVDAVVRRHSSLKAAEKVHESSSGRRPEASEATPGRVTRRREDSRRRSSGRDKPVAGNNDEHSIKRRRRRAKVTYSELVEARAGSCKEYEPSRWRDDDGREIRELQKRVVELRLRREREDLQKYLHELRDLRLGGGSASTPDYFSPSEFPRIAEFTPPDPLEFEPTSRPDDQLAVLRERVSAIRRQLKDQYILYRDYCAVAQAINARYVPTTLEDTKKTIRELREKQIKIR
ncbi:PREDICTED: protein split ends-like [Dinoponera quadriceps]|uniref:Protein split ends-like n=1 Tax=Dinoponera quadriceps TaxID=609295 RepID=A0A6P3Y7Q9_DINQU|nr:PREDICTED: protein split ends-like [Dinoponera quadriceps]